MKKSISSCLIFMMIIQCLTIFSFADSNPRAYIKDVIKMYNSDEVTVELYTENLPDSIVALGFNVKYDPTKLEYISSKAGKDLSATMKDAENISEENRISIGIVSMTGLKNSGHYYSITFKVLDDSSDIDVKLELKEASDSKGNDVNVNVENGKIKVLSAEENVSNENDKSSSEKKDSDFKISFFETEEIEEPETIPNILQRVLQMVITYDDTFNYVVKDENIVQLMDDGTIIPNYDGSTKVRVKFNDEDIGTLILEIKDGKLVKVTGTTEILNIKEKISFDEIIIPALVVIVIVIMLLILFKKYMGRKK